MAVQITQITLPQPTTDAVQHSQKLIARIKERIMAAGGVISFAEFMNTALTEPGLGYYSAGAEKFGACGDFVTAPEISPLFGQCLANAIAPLLISYPEPTLLELGAGTGRLAADLLSALADKQQLPDHYYILEISADLKQRQQIYLQQHLSPDIYQRIEWLTALPINPFNGIILANEVLDALPVHRLVYTETGWQQQGVTITDDRLHLTLMPADKQLIEAVHHLSADLKEIKWPVGYTTEVNTVLPVWLSSLAACLAQGALLLIDYGFGRAEYYSPERTQGTLACFYRHLQHRDPLFYPGLQDITAHVDFTAVAEAAVAADLAVAGYTSQAAFLLQAGLLLSTGSIEPVGTEDKNLARWRTSQQIWQLTAPDGMGEVFKVMLLLKGNDINIENLFNRDLRFLL